MLIEIIEDDLDLFNYNSDQIRRQLCKMILDLWGVNIVFRYSKNIKESTARGANTFDKINNDLIDPIGHKEEKEEKQ